MPILPEMASVGDPAQLFVSAQHLAQAGRLADARAAYSRCIEQDSGFLPAVFALGQLLLVQGDIGGAHRLLSRAIDLAAGNATALRVVAPALAGLLARLQPAEYHSKLDQDVRACLDEGQVNPQPLSRLIAAILLLKYPERDDLPDEMSRDPLWIAFLTRCLNTHPAMEARLTTVRRRLLTRYADGKAIPHAHLRVINALALQAFAGEYVWPIDSEERQWLDGPLNPVLGALYRPLVELGPASTMRKLKKDRLSTLLVKRTVDDLLAERALAAAMPTFDGESESKVSAEVRDQYEQNPYPRWQAPPVPRPTEIYDLVAHFPGIDPSILPPRPPSVLIAGCGTGHEAVGVARTDPGLTITAVDLSRTSLAYAQRMATALEVPNITFLKGDILDVPALGRQFDLIYSTGVLHHMEHPDDGLMRLCGILKPGGLIRIGLYSQHARAPINLARDLIEQRGWQAANDDIREFRRFVLELPSESPIVTLRESDDFYSLSGCRDLAFHVQEHQYTLPAIGSLVRDVGLNLVGIEPPDEVLTMFTTAYGPSANTLDLERWDALERRDTSLFRGMYLLWCQKPGA